jgi:IS30 family transposase
MLTEVDREEISRGVAESLQYKEIAAQIGRDPSIVSREIVRHGGLRNYRATIGAAEAARSRSRPKPRTVDRYPGLSGLVTRLLRNGWSPASVAGILARHRPLGTL